MYADMYGGSWSSIRDEKAAFQWLWENPTTCGCVIDRLSAIEADQRRFLRSDYPPDRPIILIWQCMGKSKVGYELYRQSDHWKFVRDWIVDFVGCCELCGATEYLQAHHLCYKHLGYERPGCLTVLCRGCHKHFHFGDHENGLAGRLLSKA
jgi:hypothetical protein